MQHVADVETISHGGKHGDQFTRRDFAQCREHLTDNRRQ